MAVNRYFNRTLMPYNPIERPLPFDQILQAGMLKQQSLDNTVAAAEEFKAQKQLIGGAQTTQLAQDLNTEYFSEADMLQSQLRSGEVNAGQAAARLGAISTRYSQDPYVKEVLMDQADPVRGIAAAAGVDPDLIAKKAINPNFNYETNTWHQKTKGDIDKGWHAGETNYGLLKDPGFLEDHATLIAQLTADSMSKKHGVPVGLDMNSRMFYNQNTGEKLEALTPEKVNEMVDNYVYGPQYSDPLDLEKSDRTSVKFRLAQAKMEGGKYERDDYANEFKRNMSFFYFNKMGMTDQTTARSAGRSKTGSTKTDFSQGAATYIDVTTAGKDIVDKYEIPRETALEHLERITGDEVEYQKMFHRHSGPYKLDPESTMDDPKFVYSETGKEVTKRQDLYAAKNLKSEFDEDMSVLKLVGRKSDKIIEEQTRGRYTSVEDFRVKVTDKYLPAIEELLYDKAADGSVSIGIVGNANYERSQSQWISDVQGFKREVNQILGTKDGVLAGGKNTWTDSNSIFDPDWSDLGQGEGAGVYVDVSNYFRANATRDEMSATIKNALESKGINLTVDQQSSITRNLGRETPVLNIAFAAEMNDGIRKSVEKYMYPGIALQVMEEANDPDGDAYRNAMKTMNDLLDSHNSFRLGVIMNPDNEFHKEIVHAASTTGRLALKSEEGTVGSGDKAGDTLAGALAGTGAIADDYKLTVVYPDLDPQGNYTWYGVMKYSPRGKRDEGVAEALQGGDYGDLTEVSVNLDDKILAASELDLEFMGRTSDVIRNKVFFMEPEETQPLKIPSMGYGPAINMNITKYGDGFELDGDMYTAAPNGEVMKVSIMEWWKQAQSINPRGLDLIKDEGTAANIISSALMSVQQVKKQYTYLYDDNGNYLGADIPPPTPEGIIERKSILGNTLISEIDEFKEAFKNLKGVDNADLVESLVDIIGFETDYQYSPSTMNDDYSAIGLIQFHRDDKDVQHKTIGGKQYNFVDLARMSIEEQVQGPMLEYFKETGSKVDDLGELYLSVYFPAALRDGYDESTTFLEIANDLYKAGNLPGQDNGMTPSTYVQTLQTANPSFAKAGTVGDVLDNVNRRIQQSK